MALDLITADQLNLLRELARSGQSIVAGEMACVNWPAPDGPIYYSHAQLDAAPNFRPLPDRGLTIKAALTTGYFLDLPLKSEIEDETIPLEFADPEREIARLLRVYGEGIPVEVFYYFPQLDALVSVWWGHLRPPSEGGGVVLKCQAASGFRSIRLNLPRRILFAGCQAIWGGHLKTLEEIAENDCGWNLHLPGGTTGVAGSQLLGPCPRRGRADCTAFLGDSLSLLNAETVVESVNNFTDGRNVLATSKGNEANLKDAVRVIAGKRKVRDAQPSAYSKQFNSEHPDQGFVRAVFPMCEGPIKSMVNCEVNNQRIGLEHLNVRLGEVRQPATNFSPSASNMSGTAHFFAVYGQVNPGQYNASNLKGSADIEGLNNLRVYSDAETFVKQYTTNRAWWLLEMERNRRWGRAKQMSRMVVQDWIDLAAWSDELVQYRKADGTVSTGTRSTFNAELLGRSTQQQISDVCLFGRYGLPFRHNGKVRILPLRKETIDGNVQTFTDEGRDANIIRDASGESQLFYSYKSAAELVNQVILTFEDEAHGNIQRPLTFSDQLAQIAAGEALGDANLYVVEKTYSALGVVFEGEAIRLGQMLLDLGEFDSGGLKNNLTVRFFTPFYEGLNLHRYKPIRVVSQKIEGFGFEYFRVMDRRRRGDLWMEVIAQAYPVDYYSQLEEEATPAAGSILLPNPGGRPGERPEVIGFDSIDHTNDRIRFRLQRGVIGS